LSLPCPWQLCPLCRAGMVQRVISLQAVANFFQDPPLPWVYFFIVQRCPAARCRSPYCFFSAPTVFTVACSLETSWCSN
jgi:hypothetical protein